MGGQRTGLLNRQLTGIHGSRTPGDGAEWASETDDTGELLDTQEFPMTENARLCHTTTTPTAVTSYWQ